MHADEHGITTGKVDIDWQAVVDRSRGIAERFSKGISQLFKKYGVEQIAGRGKLLASNQLEVTSVDGKVETMSATNIVIATGSRPKTFPGLEIDGDRVIGAKQAMVLPEIPKSLVVIGAGAIGVEFAYLYNVFGSEVTVVEMEDRILPIEDADVSKELTRQFKKQKIRVLAGTKVQQLERQKTQVKVHVSGKKEEILVADRVLMAVGVQGNVEDLGLEQVGVSINRGSIVTNDDLSTTVPNIYAIGDVAGPPWLAHKASAEGIYVAEHLGDKNPPKVAYDNIPGCTYCQPEVASVGLTEIQALKAGYKIKVGKFPFRALGKAVAAGHPEGFVKMIYDAQYGELLGTHIIGHGATDLISEALVARTAEATYFEILKSVHPHPTMAEALMEATAMAYDEAVNW
jgi:dihydrolipoamide dehydrogenase